MKKLSPPGRVPFKVVVFFDELNTCKHVCLTAEVFGGTLDGDPLPDNIFFVGAINPLRLPEAAPAAGGRAGAGSAARPAVGAHAGVSTGAGAGIGGARGPAHFNPFTGLAEEAIDKQVRGLSNLPPLFRMLVASKSTVFPRGLCVTRVHSGVHRVRHAAHAASASTRRGGVREHGTLRLHQRLRE
jgi:hypothetical protein